MLNDAWDFYVLATSAIDATFGTQKTIRLSRLDGLCEAVKFDQIKAMVDGV